MDFFLDTGPIYGYLTPSDAHHKKCIHFFKLYPLEFHNYCTTKRVIKKELGNIRRKRLEGQSKTGRLIERRAKYVLSRIRDVDHSEHGLFTPLFKCILTLLEQRKQDNNPKDRDADLLANAFLWDYLNPELDNPEFMTTDNKDIRRNREALVSVAESCVGCPFRLKIHLPWEIV